MNQGRPTNGRGLDRLPPQAVDVEQAVIGAMLIDRGAVERAIEILDEGYFYHNPHARIFSAILSLYDRSEGVDQLTVSEELKKRGELEEVGGLVYLTTLAAEVATAANIDHHARIVLDRGLSRSLIEAAALISDRALRGPDRCATISSTGQSSGYSRSLKGSFPAVSSPSEGSGRTIEEIERAHNRVSAVSGVDTGFSSDLNDLTSGLQEQDLIILAARPSVGKTALALCIARNAAGRDRDRGGVFQSRDVEAAVRAAAALPRDQGRSAQS